MRNIIELNKLQEEILSPDAFLKLSEKEKANISYSEIIAPRVGRRGDFGKIKVHYKTPKYMKIK